MLSDFREKRCEAGAAVLNYMEGPPVGPPLVLLHAGSARWQAFENILPDLAQDWHIFAPDLRGHGKSGWRPGQYRLQDYTEDIVHTFHNERKEPVLRALESFLTGQEKENRL